MTSPARHLVDLLQYAATRRRHHRDDEDVVAELSVDPTGDALGLPPGRELRWLGVAGFALTYEGRRC